MAKTASKVGLSGLARCLVKAGLLTEADSIAYHEEALNKDVSFATYLANNELLDSQSIATCASQEFGIALFDLAAMDMERAPLGLVSEDLIQRHHALPLLKRGNRLFIALSDPTNLSALDEIKFHTRLNIETVLVEEDKLARGIDALMEAANTVMNELLDEDLENLEVTAGEGESTSDVTEADVSDAPVVRFVNKVLLDAIKEGASDIHLEPYEKSFRIRFRHDGILHEVASPPINLASRVIARIKVMSRMDIAERRVPQDGRLKMALSKNLAINFRVNACPTLHGEKIVLRLLDSSSAKIGIEQLGFDEQQRKHYLAAIAKPYGMILVTGPTGSGKTVTLYTGLNLLNTPDRNISTVEDPVEITVPGVNQVNMKMKTGLTFAVALRAFLRQDPDIIMVGEIRDPETAEIAVKAAQTGHLVLSTLHTNDAPQTLNRLAQMGVASFNIASSVILIMAQRLVRRLCEHCKTEVELPNHALVDSGFKEEELDDLTIYGAVGCDHCVNGYKGRVGIYQVMPVTEAIRRLILTNSDALQLAEQARAEGVNDLRESGLNKVRAGITSLEEIGRVTRD